VTTGPEDPAVAGRDRLRAGHADRDQVIETLKAAFVHGQLTKDELDTRAGQALTARTYADLAALTADIPPAPVPAAAARQPAPARRRPLARAAAISGLCIAIAAAAMTIGAHFDPGGASPHPGHSWAGPFFFLAIAAIVTAVGILMTGMAASVEQRQQSRRQLPPRPGPGGRALDGDRRGSTGHGPLPPSPRTGQTRAARVDRTPHGARPAPGAV